MTYFLKEDYEILETFKGSDLKGVRYTPLFDFLENDEKGFIAVQCGGVFC